MYYLADFSKLTNIRKNLANRIYQEPQSQPEQKPKKKMSELRKWGTAAGIGVLTPSVINAGKYGGLSALGTVVSPKFAGKMALGGLGAYGTYRAGKSIYNRVLKRGKNNDKK